MGDFYRRIKDYYDLIFPLNTKSAEFVRYNFAPGAELLEIGCATGKLTHELSEYTVLGTDLEADFIEIARGRYPEQSYRVLDLLEVAGVEDSFDGIICFGNTLVHVDRAGVERFAAGVYERLRPGGKVLLQTVNYDYVLDERIMALPLIDNDRIRFEREYSYNDGKFMFKGRLEVKAEKVQLVSEVELYPLRSTELREIFEKAGFSAINLYGDFLGNSYSSRARALVLAGTKQF